MMPAIQAIAVEADKVRAEAKGCVAGKWKAQKGGDAENCYGPEPQHKQREEEQAYAVVGLSEREGVMIGI